MRIVEQHIVEQAATKASAAEASEELNAVRSKAGARMKALVSQNKGTRGMQPRWRLCMGHAAKGRC